MSIISRHWTPREGYATGDVLLTLLDQDWQVAALKPADMVGRAKLHHIVLQRDDQHIDLTVLDCPAVHDLQRAI